MKFDISLRTQIILLTMVQIAICCYGAYQMLDPELSEAFKVFWGGIILFNLISIFKN